MAKVRLNVSRASFRSSHKAGDVIDVSEAEAGRLIATGQAAAVESHDKPKRRPVKRKKKTPAEG